MLGVFSFKRYAMVPKPTSSTESDTEYKLPQPTTPESDVNSDSVVATINQGAKNVSVGHNITQTVVEGKVETRGGDFVGRDKYVQGDEIHIGNIVNSTGVAIGRHAKAVVNVFRDSEDVRRQHNRQIMLKLVQDFWIEGVLKRSLHNEVLIELGLEEHQAVIERPWDLVLQTPERPNRQLPPSVKFIDVFYEGEQSLILLGEPGSGKTTMLLELARSAIQRAEQDTTAPIPVIFNLSTWAEAYPSLVDWLVAEFNTKYSIPKKVALPWIEKDDLLLLLDGLDEVKQSYRDRCVEAINRFCQGHLVPIGVCCRIDDYQALSVPLKLRRAILLKPITFPQIDEYLIKIGTQVSTIGKLLNQDLTLHELAQSPFILNIIILVYKNLPSANLPLLDSIEAGRARLFDAYIEHAFMHRGVNQAFFPKQTVKRLSWLASNMIEHYQSLFLIENLQPSWIATNGTTRLYFLGSRLSSGIFLGLLTLILWSILSAFGQFGFAQQYQIEAQTLRQFFLSELIAAIGVGIVDAFRFSYAKFKNLSESKLLAYYLLCTWLLNIPLIIWSHNLIYYSILVLVFWLRASERYLTNEIHLGKAIRLTWSGIGDGFGYGAEKGAKFLLVYTFMSGLLFVAIFLFMMLGFSVFTLVGSGPFDLESVRSEVLQDLIGGALFIVPIFVFLLVVSVRLFAPIVGGFFGGMVGAVLGIVQEDDALNATGFRKPILQSLKSAALAGLAVALIVVGILLIPSGIATLLKLFSVSVVESRAAVQYGLLFGLVALLMHGGIDIILYFVLYLSLYLKGYIPWHYTKFLDYTTDRNFLRKVGGGYIFIHRLLMEHFAEIYKTQEE
jgi:hypothetical protein